MQNEGKSNLPPLFAEDSPDGPQEGGKKYSYYKALKELKDIDKKMLTMKNRLNLLEKKEEQANNSVAYYFEERQQRLRTINRQLKQKSLIELQAIKEKSHSQITLQKAKNQAGKIQNQKRIARARRIITQEKVKRHDLVSETTSLNKKTIEKLRLQALVEKREKHNNILQNSRKSKVNLRELHESRLFTIRAECKKQTGKILQKILTKRKQLKEMQEQCERQEKSLKVVQSRRERKMKKIQYYRKPITLQTDASLFVDNQSSTTPRSRVSFVIIT